MTNREFSLGVLLCIFNKDFSKILLLKRNKEKRERNKADWGNIGGHLEFGEKVVEGCIREAYEEIGLKLDETEIKLIDLEEAPFFNEKYHVIWFVCATSIDENSKIKINEESDEYAWFDLNNLPEKTLDKKEVLIKWRELLKNLL